MDVKILSIDAVGLSVRSTNALHRAEIHTVGDMLKYTEEALTDIRNLGKKSINEILEKIEEYKRWDEVGGIPDTQAVVVPEDFSAWITEDNNKQLVIDYLKLKGIKIEAVELLSARAFNLLMFAGYDFLYQIAFLSIEEIMGISRMDEVSAAEISKLTMRYIEESKEEIFKTLAESMENANSSKNQSVHEMLTMKEYQDAILCYVKNNDIEIERMGISNRPKNRLISNGYSYLSDLIFKTRSELKIIPAMGVSSVEEIMDKINEYILKNEDKIIAFVNGNESALWDDETIRKSILKQYEEIAFKGLNINELIERLQLPKEFSIDRLKSILGELISEKQLEYVDYRCYRVYGKFEDYLNKCTCIDVRSRDFIQKRLQGITLEAIAKECGLTRERVRQIVKRDIEKIRNHYISETGMSRFDEEYFKYFYENYLFEKKEATAWLGVPTYVWNYLELNDVKQGKKDLHMALEDHRGLDTGLRLKIKNYLNRNKLFIDGRWVEKKRNDLEKVVIEKFCTNDTAFDEFCQLYNQFLEQEEIDYDENIYLTEAVSRSRKNHLSESRFLLWKMNEQIRYYDIDGQDYTELLDTLNLDSYENIELSTVKFMRDYPHIMKKYDIRDQYELHNLLRKIVPEGSYHDFHCGRMPEIKFGKFDRDAAILDILIDNAPISMNDLAILVNEEYGYDPLLVMTTYLQPFISYYHQGVYKIDQKQMHPGNKNILKAALTEDFYYIDEIRNIYSRLVSGADVEEVNPYNLKTMGFLVYSRYVVQNHNSLDAYFYNLLTKEEVQDISRYKKRFVYVQSFYQKLIELKRNFTIVEFEPNQIICFKKLEQAGVTRDIIQNFCDEVYEFVKDNTYFSIQSIKKTGFTSSLYHLGFSDWFYANLLISDDRFSYATMFNNLIFYKGNQRITIKSFELNRIREHGCIDAYDLLNELTDNFGCKIAEKNEVIYKVQDTEVYYDRILDRLYANKDLYYDELEEGDF